LDAVMQLCGVPADKLRAICSAIDKLDKEPWAMVRAEMINIKGLAADVADQLGQFVQLSGMPFTLLNRLKANNDLLALPLAQQACAELQALFDFLQAFGCLDRITFDLSLARGLDYYTGVIYEAVLTGDDMVGKEKKGKEDDEQPQVGSIAAGGRYDNLVGMFSGKSVPAVGVSVGIERVFAILEAKARRSGPPRKTQTQVMVCAIGENTLLSRMQLCAELWRGGIAAEYMYVVKANAKRQMEYAMEVGVPFVIFFGETELKEQKVKLKNAATRTEIDVPRNALVSTLHAAISALTSVTPASLAPPATAAAVSSASSTASTGALLTVGTLVGQYASSEKEKDNAPPTVASTPSQTKQARSKGSTDSQKQNSGKKKNITPKTSS